MKTSTISKQKESIQTSRTALIGYIDSCLESNGGEINFLEDLGETLCIDSTNGVNQCIEGVRIDEDRAVLVFGNDEDDSCGASLGEFEHYLRQLGTDTLVSIAEMSKRAVKA